MDAFMQDCLELAAERVRRGQLDRRTFLAGLAALGIGPVALGSREAMAQAKEIVLVNWGGDALKYFGLAWGEPFTKDTGIPVIVDGTGPSLGKIKAMVDAKKVTWDVCDSGGSSCIPMGKQGYLEEIDYSVVDKTKVLRPQFAYKWGIANYFYSYVIAYDTTKLGGKLPKTWADFWNTKDFPGKRTLRKDLEGIMEAALMADGVPIDKIYPIDIDRAFKKIKEIKSETIFWSSGAESQQLIRDGEVVMGSIWSTRVNALAHDTDERISWTWNQGILADGAWVVPKGNPGGKDAFKFIASTQVPERQIALFMAFGNSPANPAALPLVPEDKKRWNPTSNADVQLPINAEWQAEHREKLNNDLLDLISS